MNLKTSFFNKSIVMSDFNRFWWVCALNTLAIFVFFTFLFIESAISGGAWLTMQDTAGYLDSRLFRWSAVYILNGIFPVGLSVLLFSYLNSVKAVACLHGMPIKRGTFFGSHTLSGLVMLVLPMLVNVIILLLFRINENIAMSFKVSDLFIFAGLYLLYTILVFSFVTAVNMISGNSVAALIFSYVFAVLPYLAEIFAVYLCSLQLYGFSDDYRELFVGFLYYAPEELYKNPLNILKYLAYTVVLFFAAWKLYKIRKLENSTEIIAFSKLRPVFVYGVAVCAGCMGYSYLNAVWQRDSLLLLIPFGVIGVIAAEMIVKKSLRVKKVYKPVIIYCLIAGVVQLAFAVDIFGFENRIPNVEKIEAVELDMGINDGRVYYTTDGKQVFSEVENTDFVSSEDIENIIGLHEYMVENRTDKSDGININRDIEIVYKMKNGSRIRREYRIDYKDQEELLTPIIESENSRKMYFPLLKNTKKDIVSISVGDIRINENEMEYTDKETIGKFVEALKKDLVKAPYREYVERRSGFTFIKLENKIYCKYEDGTDVPYDKLPVVTETYYLRDSYENTKAILAETGLYDKLPTVDDILKIGVNYYGVYNKINGVEIEPTRIYDTKENFIKEFENREEIEEIYNYIINSEKDLFARDDNADVTVMLKDNNAFSFSFDVSDKEVPECLKP